MNDSRNSTIFNADSRSEEQYAAPSNEDQHFFASCGMAPYYSDADTYASNMMLALTGPNNRDVKAQRRLYEQLCILWHVFNDPFTALLNRMEMSAETCSVRFCVPYHIVMGWCESRRNPPLYIRLMMAEAVGLVALRSTAPACRQEEFEEEEYVGMDID